MSVVDILLMGLIMAGALYLLYRSLWKKKGHCPGCDTGACHADKSRDSNA
ncbi:MAG: FeoB-associated Cys-rich membrane protein [Firmicutes bacterium]|nr:FeoB-associated Cys-rich membrane protein [Bacillota bacterium]